MTVVNIGENTTGSPSMDFGGNSIDNWMDMSNSTDNHGSTTVLQVRGRSTLEWSMMLSHPDVTDLPSGLTVSSASLNIYLSIQSNTATFTIGCHKVLRDWIETEATWDKASTTPDLDWTTGGAKDTTNDRNAAISFTGDVTGTLAQYYVLDATAQGLTDIENDVDGVTNSYGYTGERTDTDNTDWKMFDSSGRTTSTSPYLTVDYTAGGGSIFDYTITEGLVLGDTPTSQLLMNESSTEGLILGDQNTNILILLEQISEGLKLGDTVNEISVLVESLTEGIVLGDFNTNQVIFNENITEGIILGDLISSLAVFGEVVTEGLILGDFDTDIPDNLVEGPVKITVSTKQSSFTIETKKATITVSVKKPFFKVDTE